MKHRKSMKRLAIGLFLVLVATLAGGSLPAFAEGESIAAGSAPTASSAPASSLATAQEEEDSSLPESTPAEDSSVEASSSEAAPSSQTQSQPVSSETEPPLPDSEAPVASDPDEAGDEKRDGAIEARKSLEQAEEAEFSVLEDEGSLFSLNAIPATWVRLETANFTAAITVSADGAGYKVECNGTPLYSGVSLDTGLWLDGVTSTVPLIVDGVGPLTLRLTGCGMSTTGNLSVIELQNNADVTVLLDGANTIAAGGGGSAIRVPQGSEATIASYSGTDSLDTLAVTSTGAGAGIGGGQDTAAGTMTIAGGSVTVTKSGSGAGIGGGYNTIGGDIAGKVVIDGGIVVTSTSSSDGGAAIGNGALRIPDVHLLDGEVVINGGHVTSTGSYGAAAIGGGKSNNGGRISLLGGTVVAYAVNEPNVAAAVIGGGWNGYGGRILIDGAHVTATHVRENSGYGAGIGGGHSCGGGVITIKSGTVIAGNGQNGAAIGGGGSSGSSAQGGSGGIIEISGGTIRAKSQTTFAAAIGGAANGYCGDITITGGDIKVEGVLGIGGSDGNGGTVEIDNATIDAPCTGVGIGFTGSNNSQAPAGILRILSGTISAQGYQVGVGATQGLELQELVLNAMADVRATACEGPAIRGTGANADGFTGTGTVFSAHLTEVYKEAFTGNGFTVNGTSAAASIDFKMPNDYTTYYQYFANTGRSTLYTYSTAESTRRFFTRDDDASIRHFTQSSPIQTVDGKFRVGRTVTYSPGDGVSAAEVSGMPSANPATVSPLLNGMHEFTVPASKPTRTGFDFLSWRDAAGNTYAPGSTVAEIEAAGMVLTAQWVTASHLVTFDYNGARVAKDYANVEHGRTVAKPANPDWSGYRFLGWAYNGSMWDFSTPVTSDMTLVAQWEATATVQSYTVTYDYADGRATTSQTVQEGALVPGVATPVRSGYTFTSWNLDSQVWNFATMTMPARDITLKAQWTAMSSSSSSSASSEAPSVPSQPEPPPASSSRSASTVRPAASSSSTSSSASRTADSSASSPPAAADAATVNSDPPPPAAAGDTGTTTPGGGPGATDEERMAAQVGNPVTDMMNGNVPLGSFSTDNAWGLLNLLAMLAGVVMSLFLAINGFRKRMAWQDAGEDAENTAPRSRYTVIRILAIATGAFTALLFLLLENLANPMVWVNRWTPLLLAVLAVQVVLNVVQLVVQRRNEAPEEESEATY